MKITLSLSLLLIVQILSAQYSEPLLNAEVMPYFQGCADYVEGSTEKRNCSNRNLVGFIAANLNYPARAKEEGTEGTVYVSFIVNEAGQVNQAEVLHDIGGDCGREALRVVEMMPDFEPGKHEGKRVNVKLSLPVKFSLSNRGQENAAGYQITWGTLRGAEVTRAELEEALATQVQIRDRKGDHVLIDELVFSFERKDKIINQKSRGEISTDLKKVVAKAKKGGVFTLAASIQTGGEFIYVDRSFTVID